MALKWKGWQGRKRKSECKKGERGKGKEEIKKK